MTLAKVSLRQAGPEDKQFLGRLYFDTRRREVESWGWPRQQQEFFLNMQFQAQYSSYSSNYPGASDRIVLAGDLPAGRIMVGREGGAMHLIDIALLEEFRSRGIGGELILRLIAQCEAESIPLRLQVLRGNPAIRLYNRMGFVEIGADPVYLQMERAYACTPERL
jgi:ribosomal protein S18 acetylase RimI-like enzyme